MSRLLLIVITSILATPIKTNATTPYRNRSYFDRSQRAVICREPLPEFTLNYDSSPSNSQAAALCTCIWNKLPSRGHERETAIKIFKGEDPGWFVKAFIPRFQKAVKSCGGYKL